ncbi:sigma-70 family RNA polymerase sigma factor [Rhizobium sp. P44RR-XXIV]|uniref:sigma-70 family RNA polymerase sigma factor n=1 Tax=Rhizobium sp. P44RR-XXIV TaxID=1921145 RepID=UPI0009C77E74|nr:sigma-70 family RNA polymerase sigma factor [Rhizobium sp. P44RR-XXIV]
MKRLSGRDNLSSDDANQLVLAIAQRQDRTAFAELFNLAAPKVKSYMMRTGSAPELAEEIAQEAMLLVWRKASYFDPARASAATWIFTIARNLRIDLQRKQKSSKLSGADPSSFQEVELTPEELLFVRVDEERIRTAMHALSPEQETILRLSFFCDSPHSEIAKELDLPLGTVKSRIRRALVRLKTMLEETL